MQVSKHIRKPSRLLSALLCFVLIFAQLSALQHDLEHASHEHQSSCDALIAHDSFSVACDGIASHNLFKYQHIKPQTYSAAYILVGSSSHYHIRAPPLNTLSS